MDNLLNDIRDMSKICKKLDETGQVMLLSIANCLLAKQELDAQKKEEMEKEAG